jgi:hypothetical protein
LQPPTGGRVHVSMYVNDQGGLYICRYRPSVHNESSAQEERNPWVQFVSDSTQLPIIGYSSIRSSRRPGSRRRNLLHSNKSSASSRFHFQATLLKKEMDNDLTIVFSSDLEDHSHHKK